MLFFMGDILILIWEKRGEGKGEWKRGKEGERGEEGGEAENILSSPNLRIAVLFSNKCQKEKWHNKSARNFEFWNSNNRYIQILSMI